MVVTCTISDFLEPLSLYSKTVPTSGNESVQLCMPKAKAVHTTL